MTVEMNAREWLSGDRDLDVRQLVRDLVARNTELEVAVAQAVEFATYVEQAAKGTMVERARHFMSQEFAQELAARLQEDWKARALSAEADIARMTEAFNRNNGPTFMGEPVIQQSEAASVPIALTATMGIEHV